MSDGFLHDLCRRYNERCAINRPDLEWIVGAGGNLVLRTKPEALRARLSDEKRRFDDEGRKALHRLRFPVGNSEAA